MYKLVIISVIVRNFVMYVTLWTDFGVCLWQNESSWV